MVGNARVERGIIVAITVASTIAAPAVWGDSDPSEAIPVIVVTATKRSENIQTVPLSISALSADAIEQAGIEDFQGYAEKIPNLTYAAGFGVIAGRAVAIRGVQGADTTGFYIDDMPVDESVDPRVVDLQRIEVLRGPQGTLYGARSMGGTIRLITEAPDATDYSARVHVLGSQIDGGGGGYQTDATLNLPLIRDSLALRLTAYSGSDGAFINREFPNPADPSSLESVKVGRNDFNGFMASLLWKIGDNLTVRPTIMYQSSNLNGWPLSDNTPSCLCQIRPFDLPEDAFDHWTESGVTVNYTTPFGTFTSASGFFNRTAYEVEDDSQYTAYALGGPSYPGTINTVIEDRNFVEEARFSSAFSGPFQFVGGVYYKSSNSENPQYADAPGINAAYGGALGSDLIFAQQGPGHQQEIAGFGEATLHVSSQWSIIGGLRYSHISTRQYYEFSGFAAAGDPGGGGTNIDTGVTPKAVIQYQPTTDLNFYALASKGFRPGNGQAAPPPVYCAGDYASTGLTPQELTSYRGDSLWNYEIGAKSELWDHTVKLNGAIYDIQWKDLIQQSRFTCGYDFNVNAGSARSRGAEIESTVVPMKGLELTFGAGYEDAVITASSPELRSPVGSPVQQIAPWTINASGEYTIPLSANWSGIARADWNYVDHSFSANNDPAHPRLRQSYNLLNLRVGASWDEHCDVHLFVDNVSNAHANLGDDQSEGGEDPGRPRWLVNPPRTYGVEGTYKW